LYLCKGKSEKYINSAYLPSLYKHIMVCRGLSSRRWGKSPGIRFRSL